MGSNAFLLLGQRGDQRRARTCLARLKFRPSAPFCLSATHVAAYNSYHVYDMLTKLFFLRIRSHSSLAWQSPHHHEVLFQASKSIPQYASHVAVHCNHKQRRQRPGDWLTRLPSRKLISQQQSRLSGSSNTACLCTTGLSHET